jgi:hypothetical protein
LDIEEDKAQARQIARLRPFVPAEKLDTLIQWMNQQSTPEIEFQPQNIRTIVGPMGSGKTEVAHRWFKQQLTEARDSPDVAVPVWLENRSLRGSIEEAICSSNPGWRLSSSTRISIVLDGLDQGSLERSKQLLRDVREYAYTHPNASFLVTSRPGLGIESDELASIKGWTPRKGIELIRIVTGREFRYDYWVAEIMDALASPLLSLAIADRLRRDDSITVSRWDLLAGLAQSVLNEERPSGALWELFTRLAEMILDSDSSVRWSNFDEEPEIWSLTDSQLVSKDGEGLSFVLPVFEHFFGSRSLIEGRRSIGSVVAGDLFPRWRYAIAFAIATSSPDRIESLLTDLATANPGALSWILEEITPASRNTDPQTETAPEIRALLAQQSSSSEALIVGSWLRESYDAIMEGLGPVGSLLDEAGPKGEPERWGIWFSSEDLWLTLAIGQGQASDPIVTELDEPWPRYQPPWHSLTGGTAPSGSYSRWRWGRDRLRTRLENLFNTRTLSCAPDSPLTKERVWYLSQIILFHRTRTGVESMELEKVKDEISRMLAMARDSVRFTWKFGGLATITSEDVWWLYSALEEYPFDVIESPWALPDRIDATPRTVEDAYSPEQTLVLARQVLEAALAGYRDLVETNFPSFGSALGLYGRLPVRIDGLISYSLDGPLGMRGSLGLKWRYLDKASLRQESVVQVTLAQNEQDRFDFFNRQGFEPGSSESPRSARFFDFGWSDGVLQVFGPRAATNLAYEWLGSELHSLGWLERPPRYFGQ